MDGRLIPVAATGARRLYMGPYGKEDTQGLYGKHGEEWFLAAANILLAQRALVVNVAPTVMFVGSTNFACHKHSLSVWKTSKAIPR